MAADPSREIHVAHIDVKLEDLVRGQTFLKALLALEKEHEVRLIALDYSVEESAYYTSGARFKLRRPARKSRWNAPLKLISFRGRI